MKRPIQHIIEEESRSSFSQIIPHSWVKNDFIKDYGKDIHIEIFKKSHSTGNTFTVQLKGSQKPIKNNSIAIQLKVSVLQYYQTLQSPLLLVFYSTQTKQFWGIWANCLLEEIQPKKGQKNITVALSFENIIDQNYFIQLEDSFSSEVAYRLNLAIEQKGDLAALMVHRLKGWCELYFQGFFEINNATFPHNVHISIVESNTGLTIQVRSKRENITLEKIPRIQSIFLHSKLLIENELEKEELELLFVITSYFSEYSPQNVLKLLSIILYQYNGKLKTPKSLQAIADFALANNLKHELQILIDNSIKAKQNMDFQILNSVLIQKKELFNNYLSNLLKAYETFSENKLKGALAYNIANYYRFSVENYLAVKYFMLAKNYHPDYLTSYYWWSELAGVLYTSSHDLWAEKFYRKAISLDANGEKMPLSLALLADCIFHQARFSEAYALYNEYCKKVFLEKNMLPNGEYSFKGMACLYLIEKGYDKAKIKRNESIKECAIGIENSSKINLENSLAFYPLNYHSWYHLAYLYRAEKDYKNAYYSFLISGLLVRDNKRTWVECLISSFSLEEKETPIAIFFLMIELVGNVSLNEVVLTIYQISELTVQEKESITKEFTDLFNSYKKSIESDIYKPPFTEYRTLA